MRVCIAGKNKIAIDTLNLILEFGISPNDILVLYNRNEDGKNAWQPSFKYYCQKLSLKEVSLNQCYEIDNLVFLSTEFDRIIRPSLFKTSRLFNIHFSALPAYKGMYTAVMPLLNGEKFAGVTLHKIEKGIDTGDIIDQIIFDIGLNTNARNLYDLFLEYSRTLIARNLDSLLKDRYQSYPQAKMNSSYYSKTTIDFSNIKIDLNRTAWEIHNQIRAFAFRPYQLPMVHGHYITHSRIGESKSKFKPGLIMNEDENHIRLSTVDYDIDLFKDRLDDILDLARHGQIEELEQLHSAGFDIFEKNNKGWDTLIVAAYYEQTKMCKWLLSKGANVNTENYNGTHALMYAMTSAAQSRNSQTMHMLIDHGAAIDHRDLSGKSLLEYVQESGSKFVIDFFESFSN